MIAKNIIKITFLNLFLLILFVSSTNASSFCDLKDGSFLRVDLDKRHEFSCAKNACMASEHFPLPPEFIDQTKKMIQREFYFRHKCEVAGSTNVAQLCIYGIYKDKPDWAILEAFNPQSCKGYFYLSGNSPISLPNKQERKTTFSSSIDVQKISHEKGYIEIRQRPQPLLQSIEYIVRYLSEIEEYIDNPTSKSLELAKYAIAKDIELKELIHNRDVIIDQLSQQVSRLEMSQEALHVLEQSTQRCISGILRELIRCLKINDFNFNEMKDAKSNENIREHISSIQKELSGRKLSELLNSKHFNLACSEPLLLEDMLDNELSRVMLLKKIKTLTKSPLDRIIIQLHSTKAPCKSCIIGCCGHARNGIIKNLFDEIYKETKQEDINLNFVISYDSPYEDDYPFLMPVVQNFNGVSHDSILLVNMQIYDHQFIKIKQRVTKEVGELLLQEAKKKGSLNAEDIKGLLGLSELI